MKLAGLSPERQARLQSTFRRFTRSDVPITVYGAIALTMGALWVFQAIHPDLTLGLFTELLGAAFTLFIIDTLLVRSKTKRWKVVRAHLDYLIARNINRLRDGLAVRAFGFEPEIGAGASEEEQLASVRTQRAALLNRLEGLEPEQLAEQLNETGLFDESTYLYLNEKADDLWEILNMKYSEYMDPELVSILMRLHTTIKDVGAHIRQYAKAERFPADSDYYHRVGLLGAGISLKEVITLTNELKLQGYSEAPQLSVG